MPDVDLVTEDLTPQPINPYGATKYVGEWMLADAERAHGLRTVALRYFNVAGSGWPELADTAVMNLVPIVLDQLEQRSEEHTSELQSRGHLVCRLLLEKKK